MATKKEIMAQLLKGVSWNDAARLLRCSKATVAKRAAKMHEAGIDGAALESMTEAEVSGSSPTAARGAAKSTSSPTASASATSWRGSRR